MNKDYNEAFTMICAASYFAKEALKFKTPEGVPSKISEIAAELEEIKQDMRLIEGRVTDGL